MAGGSSSRMGTDKAFLDAGRGPNLERLAKLGLARELSVIIVGRERPANWPIMNVQFIPDKLAGQGPLGGLVTILEKKEAVICIACDFFAFDANALDWLVEQAMQNRTANHTGFAVISDKGIEPLCAYYTAACFHEASQRLQNGERALHKLIDATKMEKIKAPSCVIAQLHNMNTPDEWQKYQKRMQQQQEQQ